MNELHLVSSTHGPIPDFVFKVSNIINSANLIVSNDVNSDSFNSKDIYGLLEQYIVLATSLNVAGIIEYICLFIISFGLLCITWIMLDKKAH